MAMAQRAPAPIHATASQTRMERTRFMVAQAPPCRPSRGEKGDVRHRMRDFEQRQLPKGFCRANPLELCEFADKMLRTKQTLPRRTSCGVFCCQRWFSAFLPPDLSFPPLRKRNRKRKSCRIPERSKNCKKP